MRSVDRSPLRHYKASAVGDSDAATVISQLFDEKTKLQEQVDMLRAGVIIPGELTSEESEKLKKELAEAKEEYETTKKKFSKAKKMLRDYKEEMDRAEETKKVYYSVYCYYVCI